MPKADVAFCWLTLRIFFALVILYFVYQLLLLILTIVQAEPSLVFGLVGLLRTSFALGHIMMMPVSLSHGVVGCAAAIRHRALSPVQSLFSE